MFDIGWPELMVVMVIALLVIGPKDLPKALRQLGRWVGAARRMSSEFQRHVDDIVRETELDDVKRGIDKARSMNIRRELEKQIDPDGSLNKAFDVPGRNSQSGRDIAGPVKSWREGDARTAGEEKPETSDADAGHAGSATAGQGNGGALPVTTSGEPAAVTPTGSGDAASRAMPSTGRPPSGNGASTNGSATNAAPARTPHERGEATPSSSRPAGSPASEDKV